ncbi:MAG: bifunctional nuclease family protein [Turneriella sp.]
MLPATVREIAVTPMGFAAVVQPEHKDKIIPIFIGPSEAYSISTILQNEQMERPVGADLLRSLIEATGSTLSKIFINDFHGGTFFARIYVQGSIFPGSVLEMDARPSDAIALAVRFQAPIYVAEHVYDRTAIDAITLRDADADALRTAGHSNVDEILTADEREEFFEAILEEFGEKKKSPKETKETTLEKVKFYSRNEVLQQMLKTALGRENYEEAARLRDELRTETNN